MFTTNRSAISKDYEVVDANADNVGACSLCGYKHLTNLGYRRKAGWLKQRYPEGLRYKVLRSKKDGDIGMIEYVPGEHSWRPVAARGYLVIHCLMVNRRHADRGLGSLLLDTCLRDAKKNQCRGVAVVTSSGSFMAKRDLFIKSGFVPVASSPPCELLVKKFNQRAPDPGFIVNRDALLKKCRHGLTILAADQCPLVPKWVDDIVAVSKTLKLKAKVVRVTSAGASRKLPTPYGMFSIIYKGTLIAGRPVSATRFRLIMKKIGQPASPPTRCPVLAE